MRKATVFTLVLVLLFSILTAATENTDQTVNLNPVSNTNILTPIITYKAATWSSLAALPFSSSGPFAGYSIDVSGNPFVHVFGGNPGPQNDHEIYDIVNGTWATGIALPAGSNYGGHCSVNNKIYMIGARTAGPASLITVYDADGDCFYTKTLPHQIGDPAVVVYQNRYIYILGGCLTSGWTASTSVMLYDIEGDSFFTTVTQLPGANPKTCAAAGLIEGDTIVIAAGIGSSSHEDLVLFGAINPSDPATITWTTGPVYPGGACYRLNGADWAGEAYFTGGSNNSTYFVATHKYVANTGWVTLPNKPNGCSNFGLVAVPVDTSLVDDVEGYIYAAGGYTGSYHTWFEELKTDVVISPSLGNYWDFEDGWQGWTHTSDSVFPAAWGVVDADQGHSSYICPDAGDSSMWIDSDAAGNTSTQLDTAMSPAFASFQETYLKWAYSFNQIGADTFRVIIGTWSSGVLTWVDVADYNSDEYGAYDSTDVSSLLGDSFHVGFYYYGDYSWYAAFDNIGPVIVLAVEEQPIEIVQNFQVSLLTSSVFSNNVAIQYALPVSSEVSFRVFDLSGREVRGDNFSISAGTHTINWNCVDNNNNQVSAGTYFYCLEAGENRATGKLIIAR